MKKIKKKYIIFILILFISIGFAYLSTTLNIAGLIGYKGNKWNVYFDNIQMITNDVSGEKPVINNSKDSIDFNITFNEPSETYKFSVDIVNDGTIDAMLNELIKTGINSSNEEYLDYSVTYYDGDQLAVNDLLKHGTKVRVIVNVEYKYTTEVLATVGSNNYSLTLKYIQANDNANPVDNYYESDSNNKFALFNAKANTLSNLKIYGNNEQTQYDGYQLLKKDGLSTSSSDLNFWDNLSGSATPLSDGWIRIVGDNSSGTSAKYYNYFIKKDNLDLEPDTYYTCLIEYRNHTGKGSINITQYSLWNSEPFDSTSNNDGSGGLKADEIGDTVSGSKKLLLHTKSDLTGTLGLRAFTGLGAGSTTSMEVRVTIVKGNYMDKELVWEPYVGGVPSPNPNYPQDVKGVTGTNTINISGKNLLKFTGTTRTLNGITYTVNDDGSVTINGTNDTQNPSIFNFTPSVTLDANSKYYFNGLSVTGNNYIVECNYNKNGSGAWSKDYITTVESTSCSCYISVRKGKSVDNVVIDKEHFFLEKSPTFTGYEPYKEKTITLNLGNLNVYKIDDYRDYIFNKDGEWFVHRAIRKFKLENNFLDYNYVNHYYSESIGDYITSNNAPLCTHFRGVVTVGDLSSFVPTYKNSGYDLIGFNDTHAFKRIYIKSLLTSEELNNYISSNDIYLYYKLEPNNSYDEKITDTNLINQLNNLISNNLVDGTNYITVSSDGVVPDIEFDYVHE